MLYICYRVKLVCLYGHYFLFEYFHIFTVAVAAQQ